MSILQGATNIAILGGTHVAAEAGSTVTINQSGQAGVSSAFRDLSAAAAHTALHDSAARFDAPRCHRNTRAKYLDKLELWMLGQGADYGGKRLIWLTGGAGAGKSAIMQSIVERCAKHALILGTFFFFRADPSRNHAEVLIPTLAYQLARAFPEAMAVLEPVINRDPLIFKASLHTQAYELLVRPLLYLIYTGAIDNNTVFRRVFVIDGLDECSDPQKHALIINFVASILCDHHLPVLFLIASRPELAISTAFLKENKLQEIFATITLDDDYDAASDILQFIQDSFFDIIKLHPLRAHVAANWPSPTAIDHLHWKSSGYFIYAATAMKFIASPDEHPARALQVVEGLVPSRTKSPFAQLDALYLHILTSAKYSQQVLGIVRHCIFTILDHSVAAVCCIYDISPQDVALYLSDVQALVSLSPDYAAGMCIVLKHASLRDFLTDKKRSEAIYMSRREYMASGLTRYFQLLDDGPRVPSSLYFRRGGDHNHISDLAEAIIFSQDAGLLRALICAHSPQDVWNFCVDSYALDTTKSSIHIRDATTRLTCLYMCAIRDSIANDDNTLYIHNFDIYIQLVLDELGEFLYRKPQYQIIPALLFSSSPSGLALTYHLMVHFSRRFHIGPSYAYHFHYAQNNTLDLTDPRSFEAIKRLPQSQMSWSSGLAIAMKLVLQQLVNLSWTVEFLHSHPRRRFCVHRRGPMKQTPLDFLCQLPNPMSSHHGAYHACIRRGYSPRQAHKISARGQKCFILLRAVTLYLHKSDCANEVTELARKSLPKAACWFPRLMKRARADMDVYVRRWEDSLNGLSERAQLLAINDMD